MTGKPLNGRHVLAMFVGGFSIIIGVNLTLAVGAIRSFPGLEVANSYVASQSFDARRAAQDALGWEADVTYDGGILRLSVEGPDGSQVDPSDFTATIGRPTTQTNDATLDFDPNGQAPVDLAPGRWRLDLRTYREDMPFAQALLLEIAG